MSAPTRPPLSPQHQRDDDLPLTSLSHPSAPDPASTRDSLTATPRSSLASSPSASSSTAPSSSFSLLNVYLGAGAVLLATGVFFGIRLGNRQAAQIEADNPPPNPSTRTAKPPPPITPQQRAAAFRATIGALGAGTVLCGVLGAGLVVGMGRYFGVSDTKEFAVRMDSVVSEQQRRWLGSMTMSLPSQIAGLRSSIANTQLGGWIRSKGAVKDSEQSGELSAQESKEVDQAVDFLQRLEVEYQSSVSDSDKRRQAQVEAVEIDKSSNR